MTHDQALKQAILGDEMQLRRKPRARRPRGMSFTRRLALRVIVLGLSLLASHMLISSEDGRELVAGFQTAVVETIQTEMRARQATAVADPAAHEAPAPEAAVPEPEPAGITFVPARGEVEADRTQASPMPGSQDRVRRIGQDPEHPEG